MLSLIVLFIVCGLCRADYECLCNYNVEKPVLNSVKLSSLLLTIFLLLFFLK